MLRHPRIVASMAGAGAALLFVLLPGNAAGGTNPPDTPFLVFDPPSRAGGGMLPSVPATRLRGTIQVDGRPDEAAWRDAPPIVSFTQRDPDEGEPASRGAEVRILYDDEALYMSARLDGPATYRMGRRDMALLDSDWFGITLDSYHDRQSGFRFQVNPGGIQRDATVRMSPGGEVEDTSWDAVWEAATAVDADGWTVEIRIPFSQLRFASTETQTWGLQLERIIGPLQERSHWSFQPRGELGGIPTYGFLTDLEGVRPGRRLEALPFVVSRAEHVDRRGNPFRDDREYGMSAGLDLMYRLSSHLTLNAAVNPDFGQVEVDPAVVNLGVYETFFPEARPFFVEGRDHFRFTGNTSGGDLFYSRRIGRRPQLAGAVGGGDAPDVTRILGAGKVSGRTPDGWSIGVLGAATAKETGRALDGDAPVDLVVEPRTGYAVTRIRRDAADGRSSIGGIVTAVNRDLSSPLLERTLHSGAYAMGLDFRHESTDRNWLIQGSLAGSHVAGSEDAITRTQRLSHHYFQRPDATHLEVDEEATTLRGYSGGVSVSRQAGERWTGQVAAAATAPSFEVNDLGFQTRTDRRDFQGVLTYNERRPGRVLRDWNSTASYRHETNFAGDAVQRAAMLSVNARHLNYWRAGVQARAGLGAWDDRSTRGGPLMERPSDLHLSGALHSDSRRPVLVSLNGAWLRSDVGDSGWGAGASVHVRTSPRWNLSFGPLYNRADIAAQYLGTIVDPAAGETFGQRYLFAPLAYTQLNADVRLNFAILPRLTLEMFVQPLVVAFDFDDPMELEAPRTFSFVPYGGVLPELDNTMRSLRGNAVLRWEWRPGSTLYLAWQQSRLGTEDTATFAPIRDTRGIFNARPDNIFVLKMNYWLNI